MSYKMAIDSRSEGIKERQRPIFVKWLSTRQSRGDMKGTGPYLMALSILGILVGIFMINQGIGGKGLSPIVTLLIGIFVTIKEIMDAFH